MDTSTRARLCAPLLVLIFILSAAICMHAQVTGATLSGIISDPSDGVIYLRGCGMSTNNCQMKKN